MFFREKQFYSPKPEEQVTYNSHVMEHSAIYPPFVKLGLVLREANVIQPSYGAKSVSLMSHGTPVLVVEKKRQRYVFICLFKNLKPLTSDPVEVQLSVIGFFFRPQGL